MTTLIDYLSFTVPVNMTNLKPTSDVSLIAHNALAEHAGIFWQHIYGKLEFIARHGRGSYRYGFESDPVGFYVWFGPRADTVLVECTGQGCEWLRQHRLLDNLIMKIRHRCTRIDVATDLMTGCTPSEFVDQGYSKRFRSHGFQTSETGETHYVGSRTSDRYAKVYRYAPPHPRAKFLRVEHTFKKDYAKVAAKVLDTEGVLTLANMAGATWEWESKIWKETMKTESKLPGYKHETKQGKTLRWLITQVAPSFKKLVREGTIEDPLTFIQQYFLDEVISTESEK
jgi:DNA relaxase NicK